MNPALKIYFLFFCGYIYSIVGSFSQGNLVVNPSVEDTMQCPIYSYPDSLAVGWSACSISPDYFHPCANTAWPCTTSATCGFGVPDNFVGYQMAYDGIAYMGLLIFDGSVTDNREALQVQLTQPLVPGTKYFVSAYISMADTFPYICSCDKFGFRFTNAVYVISKSAVDNFSHIHSDVIITDSMGWTKVGGSFVADSAYQRLLIGNFYSDFNTNRNPPCDSIGGGYYGAYYYLDMVCVSTDSLECNLVGINNEKDALSGFTFYPNPSVNYLNIDFPSLTKSYEIIIYDLLGREISRHKINTGHAQIDVTNIKQGIFVLSIFYNNKLYNYKLLKQ